MIQCLLTYVTTSVIILYSIVGLVLGRAVRKSHTTAVPKQSHNGHTEDDTEVLPLPKVSVVVAARNEQQHIEGCIAALVSQDYPSDLFEIIIVDDESTDETATKVLSTIKSSDESVNIRMISSASSPSPLIGKSRPLDIGIRDSQCTYVVTTDADCTPPPTWLSSLVNRAQATHAKMVCGCTVVTGHTFYAQIQRLDWMNLMSVAAGLDAVGLPLTAMGNNMLFKRSSYDDLGGFEKMGQSVTEDYLFFSMLAKDDASNVTITTERAAKNYTIGEQSLGDLIEQKKRWFAGGITAPLWLWLMFLLFFGSHVGLAILLVTKTAIGLGLLIPKVLVDSVLIRSLSAKLDEKMPWRLMLPYSIYQVFCATVLPILMLGTRRIYWKERSHPVYQDSRS